MCIASLADAQREIKAIGDNVRSLKDTTDKSLADVRKLVEDAPKAVAGSDQFKKDVEALIAGVLEKHEAISSIDASTPAGRRDAG